MTSEPRVLIEPARKGSARSPLAPAPDFGWLLLGWMGLAFALIGGWDVLLTWVPMHFGNPEWEFGTITSSLDGLPVLTMGLVLVLGAGAARGTRWLVRTMAVLLVALAVAILVAAALYATSVPIALKSVMDPVVKTGLKKAIAKTTTQAVVYPVAFAWIALQAWRRSSLR